jgi:protein phosphatase PTC1
MFSTCSHPCIQLWDVIDDQGAVDLARSVVASANGNGPQAAAQALVKHALENFSSDNVSVLVVQLDGAWKTQA